jgi:hypothetical protein
VRHRWRQSAAPSAPTLRVEGVASSTRAAAGRFWRRGRRPFRKSQGLLAHARLRLRKADSDLEQLIDVEWAPDVQGEFDARYWLRVSGASLPISRS